MFEAGSPMVFAGVEIVPGRTVDVRVEDGVVTAVGNVGCADLVIEGEGGALLPGLHDHHIHALAAAAALDSVRCGAPAVRDAAAMATALRAATPRNGWIRGVGYDEAVAGDLDRIALDRMYADGPVRVQHRGGSLWVLNGAALELVDDGGAGPLERDGAGRPTGRVWRADAWLRSRVPNDPPSLAPLSRRLAAFGVTGVTDATPDLDSAGADLVRSGLAQRVAFLSGDDPAMPYKIVVSDHDLPGFDALADLIRGVRPRAVAAHSVTRESLLLVLAVLADVGAVPGDRIEHAAIAPPEAAPQMAALGVRVITQPTMVATHGDDYLERVDPADLELLWPYASFLAAGIPVGCSSDAPYGDPDPWRAIAAAAGRLAPSGQAVAPHEAVPPGRVLSSYLSDPRQPGGPARTVCAREPADLVLLDRPLADALEMPSSDAVRVTMVGGSVVYDDGTLPA